MKSNTMAQLGSLELCWEKLLTTRPRSSYSYFRENRLQTSQENLYSRTLSSWDIS